MKKKKRFKLREYELSTLSASASLSSMQLNLVEFEIYIYIFFKITFTSPFAAYYYYFMFQLFLAIDSATSVEHIDRFVRNTSMTLGIGSARLTRTMNSLEANTMKYSKCGYIELELDVYLPL